MADDMYGANQQESNENANNESYTQQEQQLQNEQINTMQQYQQPAQPAQPQQPEQQVAMQPAQPAQPNQLQAQPIQQQTPQYQAAPSYSPAPEFGAYGPVNNANVNANSNEQNNNSEQETYFGAQNLQGNSSPNAGIFANPYTYNANAGFDQTNMQNPQLNNQPNNQQNNQSNQQSVNTIPPVFTAIISASISAIVCVIVMAFAISQGLISLPQSGSLENISNTSGPGSAIIKGGQAPDWRAVSSKVSGSVVSIQTRLDKGSAKGSGAIIDPKGYVVTNNHVIAGAKQIQVTLSNGQMYSATLVGADKTTDLAVLKLDNAPKNLKAAQFADSNLLAVGEPVMAIGNPLGYDDTATTGIVSALNRPVSVMDDQSRSEIVTNAVQIDAAINPGNSGGPTFNAAGQIIGINSSIAATSSKGGTAGSIGIGFAIPANLVKRVVSEIIKKGSVKHVALGIMIKSVAVESNGITRGGAQVISVNQNTPASKAGLKANDTIVAFDNKPVTNNYALLGYVRATAFNEKATLTVVRGGNTLKLTVKFDQEEAKVTGMNRQENQTNKGQKRNPNKNNNGSDDDDDMQQRDDGDGDDGGIFDPFGFW
ncbi:PDZ domain-containing protein [Bifidobacteriaceae bacterium NR002]|nr:PDZ domain-containing protein [Bifidobacteriaceae bacterium NR002]MDZ7549028.1 trypsin-like peptidase domain-containing protein [Bifidobacteriaceae bacterium NR047]